MALSSTQSLKQLLSEFVEVELRLRKLRQRSQTEYLNDIKGLIHYLEGPEVTHPWQLTLTHLESYIHLTFAGT